MTTSDRLASPNTSALTNGSGAAAVLAAGIGFFVLTILAIAGDKSALIKRSLVFYKPTGPLSGVTTSAIFIWLLTWGILEWRWRRKTVALTRINFVAFVLLGLSFLLTFPPIIDLF
jgi:hypothetical protein